MYIARGIEVSSKITRLICFLLFLSMLINVGKYFLYVYSCIKLGSVGIVVVKFMKVSLLGVKFVILKT